MPFGSLVSSVAYSIMLSFSYDDALMRATADYVDLCSEISTVVLDRPPHSVGSIQH